MEERLTCISYPQGVSKLDELSVNLTEWSKVAKNQDFIFLGVAANHKWVLNHYLVISPNSPSSIQGFAPVDWGMHDMPQLSGACIHTSVTSTISHPLMSSTIFLLNSTVKIVPHLKPSFMIALCSVSFWSESHNTGKRRHFTLEL